MTDSKTTQERKEVKEAYKLKINNDNVKLREEVKNLRIQLRDAAVKHNNLLNLLSQTGLNIQILCSQNMFRASKA